MKYKKSNIKNQNDISKCKIAVLPGDGVGPEVVEQGVKILKGIGKKFGHKFKFKYGLIGGCAIKQTGNPLPPETLIWCEESDAVLFGAIGDPKYDNNPSAKIRPEQGLLKLRKSLNLSINLRPVKIYQALSSISPLKAEKLNGVDLVVVRELIGGIYFGKPRCRTGNGNTAVDTSVYSKEQIKIAAGFAFELAMQRKRTVTSVDKANVLETSRLWRETVQETAREYPQISLTHMFVDNAAMQIVKNPAQFDVILTENMFGDILSDEASVLAGSIGLFPSASIGRKHALYEPIHGAFNKAAGKNIANPIGTVLSAAMMLRISFNLEKEAGTIEDAVQKALDEGYRTKDIASPDTDPAKILGTIEMGNIIGKYIMNNHV